MNWIGRRKFCMLLVVAFAITGCSSSLPPVTYVPPSPPTEAAVISGIKAAASEAKLTAPLEMSAVRPTDRGPGSYFVCLRGTWLPSVGTTEAKDIPAHEPSLFDPPPQPPQSERRVVYSVFFDNDVYKDWPAPRLPSSHKLSPFPLCPSAGVPATGRDAEAPHTAAVRPVAGRDDASGCWWIECAACQFAANSFGVR